MRIPKKDLEKWLMALRSGKYEQGTQALQSKDGYCCLGVACEELIPEQDKLRDPNTGFLVGGVAASQPFAPDWLKEVSVHLARQIVGDSGWVEFPTLVSLNDKERLSFSEIADILEKTYG